MSILYSAHEGHVICHESFLKNVYRNTREEGVICSLVCNNDVFKIETPYDSSFRNSDSPKKKLKHTTGREIIHSPQIEAFKDAFYTFIHKARCEGYFNGSVLSSPNKNAQAKERADEFYKESSKLQKSYLHGCNNLDYPVIEKVNEERYAFPSMCKFFCQDIAKLKEMLVPLNERYDLIVLDPPWWNKYIRRKKSKCTEASYQMMYNDSLKNLPISQLVSEDALIAVWCTNSDQNINALLQDVFPEWGVKYVGTWTWVKVTTAGEPVCAFADYPKKQPFERIIFGCNSEGTRCYKVPEDAKMIISVPSAIHSHKPPLCEVLSSYLPPQPNCLELFARYLLPKWTSWGNEVLKLQHMSLYVEERVGDTTDMTKAHIE